MFRQYRYDQLPILTLLGFLALGVFIAPSRSASAERHSQQQASDGGAEDKPLYTNFKGLELGMTAVEARKMLGSPSDKGDQQDFFTFGDKNSAQVYYGPDKKVYAISVSYLGGDNVPPAKLVFGSDIEPKPDGSVFKRVSYQKAGYWVAYSRTAGTDPLITITMQKLQ
jgi:hypothetical protein